MQQDIKLYEKRVVVDKEYPFDLQNNIYKHNNIYFGFNPHWHEAIEVRYTVAGEMEVFLDQQKYILKQGDFCIANSNVLHSGNAIYSLDWEEMVIILDLSILSGKLASRNIVFQPLISGDGVIEELMLKIRQEYIDKNLEYQLTIKGYVLQLFAYLSRYYIKEELTEKESVRRLQKLERFTPVIRYIGAHYSEPVSNSELAEIVHLGEDRFNHLFKEVMGISPLQYINSFRMEKAMHLLKMGQYTPAEVAEQVGIMDYNHFGRLFRRTYGCTPSQILKDGGVSTET